MTTAKHIKIAEFLSSRKANPKSVVIDVRDAAKFKEGHIPGAINLHKTKIESEIADAVPDKDAEIYCHCGGGQSGARAADTLAAMGYKHAHVIDGGWRSYKAATGKV